MTNPREYVQDRPWSIYALVDPRDNSIRYVGWTMATLHIRLARHLSEANNRSIKTHKAHWIRSLKEIEAAPGIVPLQSGVGAGWADAETAWICFYRGLGAKLTNSTDGGEGTLGHRHTPESLALQSASKKGRRLTPEHRRKISEAGYGRKFSRSARANMSRAQKGLKKRPPTAQMKDAMSACHPFKNKSICKNGHRLTKKNTYTSKRRTNGRDHRHCRTCKKEAQRRYVARQRAAR